MRLEPSQTHLNVWGPMISFKKLLRDRRGNVLAIAGAALPLLIGAAGLATDTIQWTLWKRQLQRAADSAAIAGVYTRMNADSQDAVEGGVEADLEQDLHTWMDLKSDAEVELLADDGDKEDQVRVTLEIQQSLPFSSMFMGSAPVIRAVATAATVPLGADYCVIGLDPSAKVTGIEISGSADLDLGDCSLIANSTNPTAAASNGSSSASGGMGSSVKAKRLAAGGGVNYSKSWDIDKYAPYSEPVKDPFYDLYKSIPSSTSGCTKNITINGSSHVDRTTGSDPDTAGEIVCITNVDSKGKPTGLTVANSITLGPATYIINGGDLTMNSTGSSLTCDGCTIVMTNMSDPTKTGSVKLTGGTLDVTAPDKDSTSVWKGIAFYQDPRATDSGKKTQNQINGNSDGGVEGVVYFGNQSVLWNGGGNLTSICLQLVAKRVEFSGSSKIKVLNQCGDSGIPQSASTRRVRLVG